MIPSDLQDFGLDVTHKVIDSMTFLQYLYEPNVGGMQVYIYGEAPSVDPEYLMYTNIGCLYLMIVYENLACFPKIDEESLAGNPNAAYEFIAKLATNYSVTYEGGNQTWTAELREGVKWHDGENLTADDVVYSLKYAVNKWDWTKPIDWVAVEEENDWEEIYPENVLAEADGDYKVKFTYIDGYHQPEDYVPNWWRSDPIVPEHISGAEGETRDPLEWDGNSIGTGPFKVKEFEPDDYMLLERFGDYWGDPPAAQEVMHKLYSDSGAMFLVLE